MKFICIGRNYAKHIEELQNERPAEPVIFMKPDTALVLKKFPFVIPDFSMDVHHEVEVLVKISKVGKHIAHKFAHKYYEEIGLGIDFTARDLQQQLKDNGLPWEKAKAFDGSAVVGEFFPKEQFESLENLTFELTNNGKTGDILFTGTPEGVAAVKPGDVLEGFLEGRQSFRIQVK